MKFKFLLITVVGFSVALLFLLPPFAKAFSFPEFKDIRSTTLYPFPYQLTETWGKLNTSDLEIFRNDIAKMKINGINAVWLVLPWHQFETVALPEEQRQYDQAAFNNLKQVVSMLEEKNMVAILPLNYGGKGWFPGGVDWRAWLFNHQTWGAFYTYTARIATELKNNPNVIFLFFSEGMALDSDAEKTFSRTDSQISQNFRNWAYGINPDLSYWNQRWGLSYASWSEMLPEPPPNSGESVNGARYTDHTRWTTYKVRNTLGTLAKVIKQWGNPNVKVGFHDLILLAPGSRFVNIAASGESPIPDDHSFDLFSIVNYPQPTIATTSEYWIKDLQFKISRVKAKHPGLPIFLGETGMDTSKWTEQQEKSILPAILQEAKNQGVGFNIWQWQDTTQFGEIMGLLDVNGNEKPMFQAIKSFLIPPLKSECVVDSDCYPSGFVPGKCGPFYTCSTDGKCHEGSAQCPLVFTFKNTLWFGIKDSNVGKLQEFLAKDKSIYPEGLITSYFGSLTKKAVQRFQCKYNIICSGDEKSTGYGQIGPKTRAKLNE